MWGHLLSGSSEGEFGKDTRRAEEVEGGRRRGERREKGREKEWERLEREIAIPEWVLIDTCYF